MHLAYFLRQMMQRLCRNGGRAVFISCWVCERKHRIPKRWVNHHENTSTRFDRSAFRDVTAFTLAQSNMKGYVKLGWETGTTQPSL